jgi:cytochrome c biogenesis factor
MFCIGCAGQSRKANDGLSLRDQPILRSMVDEELSPGFAEAEFGRSRWPHLIVWDGVLPLVVATIPWVVAWAFPRNDIAEVGTVVLLPMVAALIRSVLGYRQIYEKFQDGLTAKRQVVLAVAIILLMLFEGCAATLAFDKKLPRAAWGCSLALFGCYLVAIGIAFNPRPAKWELD